MLLKKLLIIACAFLPTRNDRVWRRRVTGPKVAGAGSTLASKSPTQDTVAAKKTAAPKPPEVDPLLQQSIDAARKRIDAQRAYYEEGRITLDRFIDACRELELAQLMVAQTDAERTAIKQRHIAILKEIEDREKAEMEVGRGTISDLSEAIQRRVQAETELKSEQDLPSILRRWANSSGRSNSSKKRDGEVIQSACVSSRCHEVEGPCYWLDRAVVMHQRAPIADEKALGLHHLEVEDRLDLTALDALDTATPPRARRVSPGLRSRAATQPCPAFQNRWISVARITSVPRLISTSRSGLFFTAARTG